MRLESVRALKQELLDVPPPLVESVADTRSFSAFARRRDATQRAMDGIALGVDVKRKQPRLAVRLQQQGPLINALTEEISRKAKGEVDIQFVGNITKFASVTQAAFYQQRRRPLRIGSSISDVHANFELAGTLGCFVVRRKSPKYIGILSNSHVIANEGQTKVGSPIVQPGTLDGGKSRTDVIGELGKVIKFVRRINFVDAAVADLYEGIEYDTSKIGNLGELSGKIAVTDLPEHAIVHKVGRTTGQTKGRVTAIEVDNVDVEYDMGVLRFNDQIEIEGAGTKAFSDSGDSGSLIADEDLKAVGLLFAGGDEGGHNNKGLTYANPIDTVLDALDVNLEI